MTRTEVPGGWGQGDTSDLRDAFYASGHTQNEFGRILEDEFGLAAAPSQPTISRWLRGRAVPKQAARSALRDYCDTYGRRATPQGPEEDQTEEHRWHEVLRDLSGEPLLGPRQAALLDGVIQRLTDGPALSEDDVKALRILGAALGLPIPPG